MCALLLRLIYAVIAAAQHQRFIMLARFGELGGACRQLCDGILTRQLRLQAADAVSKIITLLVQRLDGFFQFSALLAQGLQPRLAETRLFRCRVASAAPFA